MTRGGVDSERTSPVFHRFLRSPIPRITFLIGSFLFCVRAYLVQFMCQNISSTKENFMLPEQREVLDEIIVKIRAGRIRRRTFLERAMVAGLSSSAAISL